MMRLTDCAAQGARGEGEGEEGGWGVAAWPL